MLFEVLDFHTTHQKSFTDFVSRSDSIALQVCWGPLAGVPVSGEGDLTRRSGVETTQHANEEQCPLT